MTYKKSAEKVDLWTVCKICLYLSDFKQLSNPKQQSTFAVHFFTLRFSSLHTSFKSPLLQSTFQKWTKSGLKVDCHQITINSRVFINSVQ